MPSFEGCLAAFWAPPNFRKIVMPVKGREIEFLSRKIGIVSMAMRH